MLYSTEKNKERVILVAVDDGHNEFDVESCLDELKDLAKTAGAEVVGRMIQNREAVHKAHYLGKGKMEELKNYIEMTEATGIVCDDDLSPNQMRNMAEMLDTKIMNRTLLILDIFAQHAQSAEGKLQVELAQLKYNSSHLVGQYKYMSRLGGGIGPRGPGETKLETDRRHIRSRIASLEHELREMEKHRKFLGSRRRKDGVLTAAIVGYTNAGKSTLFNMLTDAGVLAEDKLFATLDVTARALELPDGRSVLLSDTVGLIRRLPHHLVEAFRSTLEETARADLILHVLDASEPDVADRMQITQALLDDLGCAEIPQIHVLNKADLVDIPKQSDDENVWISAKHGDGLDALLTAIVHRLPQTAKRMKLCIPYAEGSFLQTLREEGKLFSEEYTAEGTLVDVLVDVKRQKQAAAFLVDEA